MLRRANQSQGQNPSLHCDIGGKRDSRENGVKGFSHFSKARGFNDDLHQPKAELAEAIKAFRHAQEDLTKLRESGMGEEEIRRLMRSFGFAGVTPDEIIAARTTAEVVRLIEKMIPTSE